MKTKPCLSSNWQTGNVINFALSIFEYDAYDSKLMPITMPVIFQITIGLSSFSIAARGIADTLTKEQHTNNEVHEIAATEPEIRTLSLVRI
jgi:hypothetical protein